MLGATPTWPPPDTDRNRFLFRLGFPLGVLVTAYVLTFALVSRGWLPILVAILLFAGTLMLGIGLLLMRSQRREGGATPASDGAETPDGAGTPRPGRDPRSGRAPGPGAPTCRGLPTRPGHPADPLLHRVLVRDLLPALAELVEGLQQRLELAGLVLALHQPEVEPPDPTG